MVLVIDDEKNIREALKMSLKMDGYDVITAEDGAEGLTRFEAMSPDAVILDLKMPKMSGMEFLKRAKAIRPEAPVIILTGHGGVDEAVESMREGAYDFHTKPINLEKLNIS
jgi:DNA-binding NtrC family response regulator